MVPNGLYNIILGPLIVYDGSWVSSSDEYFICARACRHYLVTRIGRILDSETTYSCSSAID